ncbi:hypothetical protein D9619_006382 [Psilocybe cf. subviscida]|uniref:Uncharacterized protein n=1 Tax=Psilocybe cf. subviscida TaxID=2480587 RepID=A0A8H5B4L6_9AGAR|nr:hypothetical protein D9619_006382 [Psilocybe cf. subviscida]
MATSTSGINISLESHLVDTLKPLYELLPREVAQELQQYISDTPPALIPYKTLLSVSQWARTDGGQKALKRKGLDATGYSMVALLAGTTTSPERKFGTYVPPKDPEEVEKERVRERKTITALVNGLLSVGCVGFAAWWAGARQGWQMEWRALFALFAAFVVAIAEGGLYFILSSRQSKQPSKKSEALQGAARYKKIEPDADPNMDTEVITDIKEETRALRRRK